MQTKNLFIYLAIFLLVPTFCYAAIIAISYDAPRIFVKFDEEAIIQSAVIKNSEYIGTTWESSDNYSFNFTPSKSLSDGVYIFEIKAKDLLGNSKTHEIQFQVLAGETVIKIIDPSHGVSPTSTFDIVVRTNKAAYCNYSVWEDPVPIDSLLIGKMKPFDETVDLGHTHIIRDYKLDTAVKDFRYFYVKCVDDADTEVPAEFILMVLSEAPAITAVPQPSLVVEEDIGGTASTDFVVSSNQDVVCKYSNIDDLWSQMQYFDREDFENASTFKKEHIQKVTVPLPANPPQTYTYYVECKNLAELGQRKTVQFTVNPGLEMTIIVNEPKQYISTEQVTFNITTTEGARCKYYVDGGSEELFQEIGFPKIHVKQHPSDLAAGAHTVRFRCQSQESIKELNYGFTIDTTAPTELSFNKTKTVTCGKEGDWELEAEWEASDPESPIDRYEYAVFDSQGHTIVNWTQTSSSKVSVDKDLNGDDLNLSIGSSYYFKVDVMNAAGLWAGRDKFESPAIVARNVTSVYCKESEPPRGWVTFVRTENGANVTVHCSDDTGCDMDSAKYGFIKFNTTGACTPDLSYIGPVEVLYDGIFCFKVFDTFGNSATGQEEIRLTLVDSDGDGIPDVNDKCPFTKTEEIYDVDQNGCGISERDTDGDGIRDIDDKCPDSEPGLNSTYMDDTGCYVDSDDDGMPDFWEERYNLDPDDPADANFDNDGDGYINLLEYQYGTDPNDANSVPYVDSDNDGVQDLDDKCPNTPTGESVDAIGCSGSQKDSAADGVKDNIDACPDTKPKVKVDDKGCPLRFVQFMLLILGVVLLFGGAGYLLYTKVLSHEKKPSQPPITPVAPERKALYPARRVPSLEEQREMLARREMEKRRLVASQQRSRIFSRFAGREVAPGIRPAVLEKKDMFTRLSELGKEKDLFARLGKIGKTKEITKDEFDRLAKFAQMRKQGIFSELPKAKVDDVWEQLSTRFEQKIGKDALDELERFVPKKKVKKGDIVKMLASIKAPKKQVKNVFAAVLRYLLDSGKISKNEVSQVLLKLADQSVISKGDVADVLYELRLGK
ncbi:thrombospondin type 3 repeat-containing protein [Candidatus Woesearchaeota archaeon]|nr:thrombospondin type 3 repeat-containing protein [Candidatus Woesearchaeota archaeon]